MAKKEISPVESYTAKVEELGPALSGPHITDDPVVIHQGTEYILRNVDNSDLSPDQAAEVLAVGHSAMPLDDTYTASETAFLLSSIKAAGLSEPADIGDYMRQLREDDWFNGYEIK